MDTTFLDRHMRSLALARECATLGARRRTIVFVTGLHKNEVARLLFEDGESPKPGRHPESAEWLYKCNLFTQVEASTFVAIYRRLRALGLCASESLVAAFKCYRAQFVAAPRLNFERAFDLACHTDGIWSCDRVALGLHACARCGSHFLSSVYQRGSPSGDCPFCKLLRRYRSDKRVQEYLPKRSLVIPSTFRTGFFASLLLVNA